jgi:hypothetical protein
MEKPLSRQESAKALKNYNDQQSRFKAGPATVSGSANKAVTDKIGSQSRFGSTNNYYTQRKVTYGGYQPPPYAYGSYSSFGMWDAMFLWFMLDNMNQRQYSEHYYHHRDDPGMKKWREEAEKQAKDNDELKAKLAALDQKVESMKGTPKDPSYIPPDAGAVVLAKDVAEKTVSKEDDGGFPWFWTIVILAITAGGIWYLRRRNA